MSSLFEPALRVCVAFVLLACFTRFDGVVQAQPTLGSPVVSPETTRDGRVTLRLSAPTAREVRVMGDFLTNDVALTKDDKGVWSHTTPPLSPGVYGYYFRLDSVRIPDPGNLSISSGATYLKSYVEVSGEQPAFWSVRDVPHGTLHEHLYKSSSLGTTRRIVVYTPPGYDPAAKKTYPVLYLYHGAGDNETFWTRVGRANHIMDNLLADGKTRPALIVSCFGHSSVPPGPEAGTDGVELYEVSVIEKDILENIIPLVEQNYRVGKKGKDRAIAGLSMGGYLALTIGLNNAAQFGYVADFSGGFRGDQDLAVNFKPLLADKNKSNKQLKLVWIRVGATEGEIVTNNRQVEEFLTENGIKHEWEVVPDGRHSWLSWRGYLRDLLPRLFTEK